MSNWLHTIQYNFTIFWRFLIYSSSSLIWINYIWKEEFVFYWLEGNSNCIPLCEVHYFVLTSHLALDLPKCIFLSRFPAEIVGEFLISPVPFPCPICPTVFQFTTHRHSLTISYLAAAHRAILFIPLLHPLSSVQVSHSASVLAKYFRVYLLEEKHTPLNALNSV